MIFIDGSNLYNMLKALGLKASLDFGRFVDKLRGPSRRLMRTYYYNCPLVEHVDSRAYSQQQRFFTALQRIPYFEIRLGRLQRRGGTWVEKGVDVAIAVDMLVLAFASAYDTAILVSGDADYARVVSELKRLGRHVEVACAGASNSRELWAAADRRQELSHDFLDDCFLSRA